MFMWDYCSLSCLFTCPQHICLHIAIEIIVVFMTLQTNSASTVEHELALFALVFSVFC